MKARTLFLLVIVITALQSCITDEGVEQITGVGTIKFIQLEGGFHAIIADDGKNYDPVNLAKEFQQDGLRIRFTARSAKDWVSFHMWGQMVEVMTIDKL